MRVLICDTDPVASQPIEADLVDAGHQMVRCRPQGGDPVRCAVMDDNCPLERGGVDVALDVRGSTGPDLLPAEDGARCAVRHRVPLVVAGDPGPFEDWALGAVPTGGDVVDAVERAASQPPVDLIEAAIHAATDLVERHRLDAPVRAELDRAAGRTHVRVLIGAPVDRTFADLVAVRVAQAVRRADRLMATLDVEVLGTDLPASLGR